MGLDRVDTVNMVNINTAGGVAGLNSAGRLSASSALVNYITNHQPRVTLFSRDFNEDWTTNLSGCTQSSDTTNVLAAASTAASLKATMSGEGTTGVFEHTFSAQNWNDLYRAATGFGYGGFYLRYYIHEGTSGQADHYTNISSVTVDLESSAGNYYTYNVYNGAYASQAFPGWHIVSPAITNSSSQTGTLATSGITKIRITITVANATDTPAVTFDVFRVNRSASTGSVYDTDNVYAKINPRACQYCLTTDDGLVSTLPLILYAEYLGIPVTMFIVTDWIGTDDLTYFNWTQIELFNLYCNVFIANHTKDHTRVIVGYNGQTAADVASNITGGSDALDSHGCSAGSLFLAEPGGYWDNTTSALVLGKLAVRVRHTQGAGGGSASGLMLHDPRQVYIQANDSAAITTSISTRLDNARKSSEYICDLFHKLDVVDYPTSAQIRTHLDNVLTMIKADKAIAVNIAQLGQW